jgi:hypothetical protein
MTLFLQTLSQNRKKAEKSVPKLKGLGPSVVGDALDVQK